MWKNLNERYSRDLSFVSRFERRVLILWNIISIVELLFEFFSKDFRKRKNLRFFIEIDFKSLILCLAIRILSTRNRPVFRFSNASRLIKERFARFLFVRRIRLQFLNCPAFELSKIYGQGNRLSVSRPEITQYLTSWETRLPGKLSLFNVSFSPWCWKNMNFRFVGFNIPFLPFFFSCKPTENYHGFIIYRIRIYTIHGLLGNWKPSGGSKIWTTWNLLVKMNDIICDIYLAHDERILLIGCNFTKIVKILASFALSLRFIV